MGIYSNAHLIYGIPVTQEENPELFDSNEEYWRDFEALKIESFGHYEDPEGLRGILTHDGIPDYSADCWSPTRFPISPDQDALQTLLLNTMRSEGVELEGEPGWYLAASVD